ncbi:MAG: hypothetical protein KDJ51_09810 [Nitratireductor sp.]|nr:hypothetical protein [Nitratireductor sp.]
MITDKKTDEDKFNETLKRMLETRPKPHKEKDGDKSRRPTVSDQNL